MFDIHYSILFFPFSSLPTGGLRMDGVVAGRGLYVIQACIAMKPLPPLPEGRNRTRPGLFKYQVLNNEVKDSMTHSRLTRSALRWTTLSAALPQRGYGKK